MTAEEIFAEIVKKRGIKDLESFLYPKYEDLADPYLLPDIKPAVKRIEKAINSSEIIAIYGDYDVDGLTATTLLSEALTACGAEVITYIPDRFKDGYGLSKNGIDSLAAGGAKLIITVDTGSLAHEQIGYAKAKGIDVIVTDHHNVSDSLPEGAVAVINPKRKDSKYPFNELAGVGVAFGLVRALQSTRHGLKKGQEKWLLDLVALGTVCDIVPLTGENRTLVYWGLKVLSKTKRPGLKKLAEISDISLNKITTVDLGYRLGPRLNASGRLDHANVSLELLQSRDDVKAATLASKLDNLNAERRAEQEKIITQALEQAGEITDTDVYFFVHSDWSHGVVGVVASKLVEILKRPVFVLQEEAGTLKGSARSFGDFHLADAIAANRQHIEKGGGHAYAAGVTLSSDMLEAFKKGINEFYRAQNLQQQDDYLETEADITLGNFKGIGRDLLDLISQLEPYGEANPQPLFKIDGVKIDKWRGVGAEDKHAKLSLSDAHGNTMDAIGFGLSKHIEEDTDIVSITTHVELNNFNGRDSVQLMVRKIYKDKTQR